MPVICRFISLRLVITQVADSSPARREIFNRQFKSFESLNGHYKICANINITMCLSPARAQNTVFSHGNGQLCPWNVTSSNFFV